jgi:hypothetical protein
MYKQIPTDVLDNIIVPMVATDSAKERYAYRHISRAAYINYLNTPIASLGRWAYDREAWFMAISEDDPFLFGKLVRALKTRNIEGYTTDGEFDDEIGDFVQVDHRDIVLGVSELDERIVSVLDMLVYCIESDAWRVFSILINDEDFWKYVLAVIGDDQDYYISSVGLASHDPGNMRKLMSIYSNDDLYYVLDDIISKAMQHRDIEGLRLVIQIMIEREVYLSTEVVEGVIEYAREGIYGKENTDTVISIYEQYPYIVDYGSYADE